MLYAQNEFIEEVWCIVKYICRYVYIAYNIQHGENDLFQTSYYKLKYALKFQSASLMYYVNK